MRLFKGALAAPTPPPAGVEDGILVVETPAVTVSRISLKPGESARLSHTTDVLIPVLGGTVNRTLPAPVEPLTWTPGAALPYANRRQRFENTVEGQKTVESVVVRLKEGPTGTAFQRDSATGIAVTRQARLDNDRVHVEGITCSDKCELEIPAREASTVVIAISADGSPTVNGGALAQGAVRVIGAKAAIKLAGQKGMHVVVVHIK